MKKISILLLAIMISSASFAHYITPYTFCSANNRVQMQIFNWDIGSSNTGYFYATKNGSSDSSHGNSVIWRLTVKLSKYTTDILNDTVGQIMSSGFKIDIPTWVTTLYGYENESGGYNKVVWTSGSFNYKQLTNACVLMPITLNYFFANRSGSDINFKWESLMEINVDHYEIVQVLSDSTERIVASVKSTSANGVSTTPVDYTYTLPLETAASIAPFLMIVLLISLLTNRKTRKAFFPAMLMMLSINIMSCTKTSVAPTAPKQKAGYLYFKLKEVDANGITQTYNTVEIKNN